MGKPGMWSINLFSAGLLKHENAGNYAEWFGLRQFHRYLEVLVFTNKNRVFYKTFIAVFFKDHFVIARFQIIEIIAAIGAGSYLFFFLWFGATPRKPLRLSGEDVYHPLLLLQTNQVYQDQRGMFEGDLQEGELEIGQVSALLPDILPAREIVKNMWEQFREAVRNPVKTL